MVEQRRIPGTGQIPHLETFCRAAELASFTRAAHALGLTQAAVSQHVRAIEHDLGLPLFRRRAGRVELNEAGRRLYEYARRILDLHAEARTALGQPSPRLTGKVHLAASTVPAECFLPGLLESFRCLHPGVRVVAEVGDSEAALATLEHGQAALALVGCPVGAPWAEAWPFAADRLALVVAEQHAWAGRIAVTVGELRPQPLVVREAGSGSRRCLERALAALGLGLGDLTVLLELGSNPAIRETVARGRLAGVLSARAVADDLASGRLHEVAVEGLDLSRHLFVVADRRRALPPPASAFLHFLQDQRAPSRLP